MAAPGRSNGKKSNPKGGGDSIKIEIEVVNKASKGIEEISDSSGELKKDFVDLTKVSEKTALSFKGISGEASKAKETFIVFGAVAQTNFEKVFKAVQMVGAGLATVYSIAQQPVVSQALELLYQEALEATEEMQDLTEVLTFFRKNRKAEAEEMSRTSESLFKRISASASAIAQKIRAFFAPLVDWIVEIGGRVKNFASDVGQRLVALGRNLRGSFDGGQIFRSFVDSLKVARAGVEGFGVSLGSRFKQAGGAIAGFMDGNRIFRSLITGMDAVRARAGQFASEVIKRFRAIRDSASFGFGGSETGMAVSKLVSQVIEAGTSADQVANTLVGDLGQKLIAPAGGAGGLGNVLLPEQEVESIKQRAERLGFDLDRRFKKIRDAIAQFLAGDNIFTSFLSALQTTQGRVKIFSEDLIRRFSLLATGMVESFRNRDIFDAVLGGLGKNVGKIGENLGGAVRSAINFAGNAMPQGGFGKLFQPLADGMSLAQEGAKKFGGTFVTTMRRVATWVGDILEKLRDKFVSIFGGRGQIAQATTRSTKNLFKPYLDGLGNIVNQTERHLLTLVGKIQGYANQASELLDTIANPIGAVSGVAEPLKMFQSIQGVLGAVTEKASEVSQTLFFFTSAFESVRTAVIGGPYQMLIGQNVELRQQLLKTQASLVATNKILRDGSQITDPSEAILALNSSVNAVLSQVRKDSLELVGITSRQLTEVFNIISTEASNAGINLQQAGKLVIDFSAALGTIGLPLEQASQEIRSIFNAQVTSDSALAKQIGLTNDQIKKLKQQGKLYDFLREKLKAFSAGNALAAQTIEGVGSNIQDLFELMGLYAGEQLLDPVVNELNRVYLWMNKNQAALIDYAKQIASEILRIFNAFVGMGEGLAGSMGEFAKEVPLWLFTELASGAEALKNAVVVTVNALQPFTSLLTELIKLVSNNMAKPFFQVFVLLKTMSFAIKTLGGQFGIITNAITGIGEAMFYKEQRMGGLINQYTMLTKKVGLGTGSMLMMGKHMEKIPFLANTIASKFGVLGKMITPLIPQISGVAIALISMSKQGGPMGKIIDQVSDAINEGLINGVFPQLSKFARDKDIPALADQIDDMGEKAAATKEKGGIFFNISENIKGSMKETAAQAKKAALAFGGMTVLLSAAAIAISEYLKRIKDAGDEIRDFAKKAEIAAMRTREMWVNTSKEVQANPMFDETYVPPSDWIDGFIEKSRQWNQGTYEVKNALDALYLVLIGIGNLGLFLVKVVQSIVTPFVLLGQMAWAIGKAFVNLVKIVVKLAKVLSTVNPLDPSTWGKGAAALDEFGSDISQITNNMAMELVAAEEAASEQIREIWGQGWEGVATKSEEELAEMARAVESGVMQKATAKLIEETRALIDNNDFGDLFGDAIAPTEEAIEALRAGKGTVKDVEEAIAALPDAFPQSERDALVRMLQGDFRTGMSEASDEAHRLAAALKAVEGEDTMLLSDTIEQFRQGKATAGDVADALAIVGEKMPAAEFNELNGALDGALNVGLLETYDSATDLNKALDGLGNTLSTSRANTANAEIEMRRKDLEASIQDYEDVIQKQEEAARLGNPTAENIIRVSMIEKKKLEAALEALNTAAQSVDIIADPVRQLENYLSGIGDEMDRLNAALEATAKKGVADLTEAMVAGDISEGFLDVRQFESDTENMARRAEELRMRLQRAYDEYGALDENELGRAQEVGKSINELSQQYSDLRIQIAQKEKERKDQLKEAEVQAIQGQLTQGLINEEEYNEQMSALQLERNQNSIDKARASLERLGEDEIEARKLIEAEIAKLLGERQNLIEEANNKELEALDRQIDKVLDIEKEANVERQRQRIEAFNQEGGNLAEIEMDAIEDEINQARTEVEQERRRLQEMVEATPLTDPIAEAERQNAIRDQRIKTSELTLSLLEKEKSAYDQLTETILANLDREQNAQLTAIQEEINAGTGISGQMAVQEARDKIADLQIQLEREKDINKQAELRLELAKAERAEARAIIDLKLQELELENAGERTGLKGEVYEGEAFSGKLGLLEASQQIEVIQAELALEKDKEKRIQLEEKLVDAQKSLNDARKDAVLQELNAENTQETTELLRQANRGDILGGAVGVKSAEDRLEAVAKEFELEKDKEKRIQLEQQVVDAEKGLTEARKALALQNLQIADTKTLTELKKLLRDSQIIQEEYQVVAAEQQLNYTKSELELETDKAKRVALEQKIVDDEMAIIEARKALAIREIQLTNTQELTQLKRLLNQRKILEEEYQVAAAEGNVERIRAELALETDRAKKIELQMQLVEAQGQLIEANINLYKAQLDKETLKYENAIKRQNRALEKQANAMDLVSKAINMRNQLMSAQQSLFGATTDYMVGGLEAAAKLERSDRRRAKINELIAAVRLKTAVEQAKFEQRSLEIQQMQQRIALEREAIEKRIAANQAFVDEKRAKNALLVGLKRGLPQEEIEALALEYESAKEISALRGVDLKLIQEQRNNLDEIQAMEQEALDLRNKGAIRSAEVEAVSAIASTGRRNRQNRELQEDILADIAGEDISRGRFATRATQQARQLRGEFGTQPEQKTPTYSGAVGRRSDGVPVMQMPKGMTPQIEPMGLAQAFSKAMQMKNAAINETNVSPTINFDVKVMGNADGAAIVREAEPRLEAVVSRMVTLSRR